MRTRAGGEEDPRPSDRPSAPHRSRTVRLTGAEERAQESPDTARSRARPDRDAGSIPQRDPSKPPSTGAGSDRTRATSTQPRCEAAATVTRGQRANATEQRKKRNRSAGRKRRVTARPLTSVPPQTTRSVEQDRAVKLGRGATANRHDQA